MKNNEEHLLDANISLRRNLQTSWEEKDRLREEVEKLREEIEQWRREAQFQADEVARLRRIEEAARRSTGPGWLENLRAALDDQSSEEEA